MDMYQVRQLAIKCLIEIARDACRDGKVGDICQREGVGHIETEDVEIAYDYVVNLLSCSVACEPPGACEYSQKCLTHTWRGENQ
jgi:hypothetical protein